MSKGFAFGGLVCFLALVTSGPSAARAKEERAYVKVEVKGLLQGENLYSPGIKISAEGELFQLYFGDHKELRKLAEKMTEDRSPKRVIVNGTLHRSPQPGGVLTIEVSDLKVTDEEDPPAQPPGTLLPPGGLKPPGKWPLPPGMLPPGK